MISEKKKDIEGIIKELVEIIKEIEEKKLGIGNYEKVNLSYLFGLLDPDGESSISEEALIGYFKEQNLSYTEKEIKYFFRFFDKDFDSLLSFDDFLNVFLPLQNDNLRKYLTNNIFIYSKENFDATYKDEIIFLFNDLINSFFKLLHFIGDNDKNSETLFRQITQLTSITRDQFDDFINTKFSGSIDRATAKAVFNFFDWDKNNLITIEDFTEIFYPLKLPQPQSQEVEISNSDTKQKVIKFFHQLAEVEDKIELTKEQLALNEEVTGNRIFYMFDSEKKGYVTLMDIKSTLSSKEKICHQTDIELLFNCYSTKEEGKFRFEDFVKLFLPLKKFKSMLYFKDSFLPLTAQSQLQICDVMYRLINYEREIKEIKETLVKSGDVGVPFNEIATENYNVNRDSFQKILGLDDEKFSLIWKRLTRRSLKVSMSEIVSEMIPEKNGNYLDNYMFK